MEKLKVKFLSEEARKPYRGTADSAGLDLYTTSCATVDPHYEDEDGNALNIRMVHTGVAVEIPRGYFGLLVTRSSLGKEGLRLSTGASVIDADYRGEVLVYVTNDSNRARYIDKGERIAQLVLVPYLNCPVEIVEELTPTERSGGFGSTGRI